LVEFLEVDGVFDFVDCLGRVETAFAEVIWFRGYDFAPEVLVASDFAVAFTAAVPVLSDSSVPYCSGASKFSDLS